jgi:hypothetical protein
MSAFTASRGRGWSVASPFGPSINPKAAERLAALSRSLVEAVRLLASAGKGTRAQGRSKPR